MSGDGSEDKVKAMIEEGKASMIDDLLDLDEATRSSPGAARAIAWKLKEKVPELEDEIENLIDNFQGLRDNVSFYFIL